MKKVITIVVILIVFVGLGIYLFKISPQDQQQAQNQTSDFDLSKVKPQSQPNLISADDHILGNPNAKNTLISYEDFECPYCAEANDMLNQVPAQLTDTKLVFRYFPLTQIHKNAVISEYAAEAAGAQGKYWQMHDLLFKNQSSWSELDNPLDQFTALAQQAGVANLDQFKNDITSKKFKDRVQENLVEAMSLNLNGTPTFYFNGKQIPATYTMDQLKQEVAGLYAK